MAEKRYRKPCPDLPKGVRCPLCGENEPFTGTCGGGRDNPRTLCYQGAARATGQADQGGAK